MSKSIKKPTSKTKEAKREQIPLKVRAKHTWQRIVVRTPRNPHHAFRLTRPRLYVSAADLKATWHLQLESWKFVGRNKRVMLGLGLLYSVIGFFLVGGISQFDYVAFKDASMQIADGNLGAFGQATSLFGAALTGNLSSPPSEVQQFLSAALVMLFWLAIVWATRMLMADKEIKIRDALYNSNAPIIPMFIMLAIVAVQLAPGALGVFGYSTALKGGWLDGGVESMAFALAAILLGLLSLYFVVSSLIGLIVITLPGTYPWQALRASRELVMNRRWAVVLRVLALAVHVVLLWGIVLIPIFLLDMWLRFDWLPLVPIAVQVLVGLTLVYTSVYIYKLYRSLLPS
jgi:hypothetical protein